MSFKLLDGFVEAGLNFIDTADVYSRWVPGHEGGESEAIIGQWLKKSGKRKDVVIATKLGMDLGGGKKGLSAKYISAAVEDSLKRLQTDCIDLYQSHRDDPETPLEETLGAYTKLIQQGKIRAIGASNYSGARLAEALDVSKKMNFARYESLQPLYNLYDRAEFEKDLAPVCLKNNVSVIPYYSLASGFLTGKYRSKADLNQSLRGGRVEHYLDDRGMKILKALDQIAEQQRATPTQVALAWLMSRPTVTAPIASASKMEQLPDLLKSLQLELSAQSIALLDQASV